MISVAVDQMPPVSASHSLPPTSCQASGPLLKRTLTLLQARLVGRPYACQPRGDASLDLGLTAQRRPVTTALRRGILGEGFGWLAASCSHRHASPETPSPRARSRCACLLGSLWYFTHGDVLSFHQGTAAFGKCVCISFVFFPVPGVR